ncbi:glycosyltransferase family 9 protein [Oryzomicrobium sp.]|uniref:glycosyltransferase family 9 protein n=1 Tax=Oryzomicrobium sp. TaxID=1911578 RepID=UPI0025D4A7A8|nr:glycosyltransferase family 9 protein [Oryzomicrobium sp.]MCE1242925.1 glycosyltransferase family 9 protein [Oryzomicrobium sp.]
MTLINSRNSRVPGRLLVALLLLWRLPALLWPRRRPATVRRVLVLHHLLLGDTVMLAGLLAKLRQRYPDAVIDLATPAATVPLFTGRPYDVHAHPFNPRAVATLWALLRLPRPDLAVIPAENRYSLLARALGARWVVAFEGDSPAWKNWLVDDLRPYPAEPTAWPDMAASLVDGPPPPPFRAADWPAPPCRPFDLPQASYCVLHVGASSPLRHWTPANWLAVADWLHGQGYQVAWSGGKGEEELVRQCDPEGRYPSYAGQLDLAQLWHLLAHAALLVSPDTGVAHLGKAAGAPCVTLFGPGSALIYGPGQFWADHPYRAVTIDPFPCRDGRMLFERTFVPWVRHCARPPSQCASPRCMLALTVDMVQTACRDVLAIAR